MSTVGTALQPFVTTDNPDFVVQGLVVGTAEAPFYAPRDGFPPGAVSESPGAGTGTNGTTGTPFVVALAPGGAGVNVPWGSGQGWRSGISRRGFSAV